MFIVTSSLYYLHILLITTALLSALFLPPVIVYFFIATHYLHTRLFNGCALTKLCRQLHPDSRTFFQELFASVFKQSVPNTQDAGFTWIIYILAAAISHATHFN